MQLALISTRPSGQLLKWVGNKFRFANEIVSYFPQEFGTYIEPFLGTGAILATLQPQRAIASDTLKPLIDLWEMVQNDPNSVASYYEKMWREFHKSRISTYEKVKSGYNRTPNPLDLLFLSRTCYGGVVRFTKNGTISTPIGPHNPIPPQKFYERMVEWHERVRHAHFECSDYKIIIRKAKRGDLVYCDPPYSDSQSILYGAQTFRLSELFDEIAEAKQRGACVALSIDGIKKSGSKNIDLSVPGGLFEEEVFIDCGHSMLRRFQKDGLTMVGERVKERLLLTWRHDYSAKEFRPFRQNLITDENSIHLPNVEHVYQATQVGTAQ